MTFFEKAFSIFSIAFAFGLVITLSLVPELREIKPLFVICSAGLIVNIAFIFVLLKNVMAREEFNQTDKIKWTAFILVLWPATIVYTIKYGFLKRSSSEPLKQE